MTNTTTCSDIFGVQYCESKDTKDFSSYVMIGFAVVALVLIGAALVNNVTLTGIELLDIPMF